MNEKVASLVPSCRPSSGTKRKPRVGSHLAASSTAWAIVRSSVMEPNDYQLQAKGSRLGETFLLARGGLGGSCPPLYRRAHGDRSRSRHLEPARRSRPGAPPAGVDRG